jgi:hypothetical protein
MRQNSHRLPKQLELDLTHQRASNAVCFEFSCFYRKLLSYEGVVLVADDQGRRGIVCEPGCKGPREGHAVKVFMPCKQPIVVHYTEHCPPDVGAAFIWLKNRDPERWRDVQNVEHVMGKYIISDRPMTAGQWAAERATVIDDVVEELPAPDKKSKG